MRRRVSLRASSPRESCNVVGRGIVWEGVGRAHHRCPPSSQRPRSSVWHETISLVAYHFMIYSSRFVRLSIIRNQVLMRELIPPACLRPPVPALLPSLASPSIQPTPMTLSHQSPDYELVEMLTRPLMEALTVLVGGLSRVAVPYPVVSFLWSELRSPCTSN